MNKLIPLLLTACFLACALAFQALFTAVRETAAPTPSTNCNNYAR